MNPARKFREHSRSTYPIAVSNLLEKTLSNLGLTDEFTLMKIRSVWRDAMGERLAKIMEISGMRRGKLVLRVPSPSWKMELHFRKNELIKNLNLHLNENLVQEIDFTD